VSQLEKAIPCLHGKILKPLGGAKVNAAFLQVGRIEIVTGNDWLPMTLNASICLFELTSELPKLSEVKRNLVYYRLERGQLSFQICLRSSVSFDFSRYE
jgi:hypothetical protein